MPVVKTRAKRWGNSLGLIIPSDVAKKEHIMEDQSLDIIILHKGKTLEKLFGSLKGWKINTQKALDDLDREEHG